MLVKINFNQAECVPFPPVAFAPSISRDKPANERAFTGGDLERFLPFERMFAIKFSFPFTERRNGTLRVTRSTLRPTGLDPSMYLSIHLEELDSSRSDLVLDGPGRSSRRSRGACLVAAAFKRRSSPSTRKPRELFRISRYRRRLSGRTVRAYTLSRGIRRSVSAAVLVREY